MRKLTSVVIATVAAGSVLVQSQTPDARQVLADLQKAIGGADKVAALRTLTATGTTQRVTPQGTTAGAVELALELPDKYVARTVVGGQGSMQIYRNAGFNGDGLINVVDAPPNLAGGGLRDRLESDRAGAAPGSQTPEQRAAAQLRQILLAKKDFARLALGTLGSSYSGFPLQFTYAGQAESADGTAHIVEARGADNFQVQLFVDTKSYLPLMMMWSDPGAGANAGRLIERRIFYSNFKTAGGLNLPHTLRRSVDGKPTEETTFAEIKINPSIDRKTFAVNK